MRNISLSFCSLIVFLSFNLNMKTAAITQGPNIDQIVNGLVFNNPKILHKEAEFVKIKKEKRELREKYNSDKYAQKYAKKKKKQGEHYLKPDYDQLLLHYKELHKKVEVSKWNFVATIGTLGLAITSAYFGSDFLACTFVLMGSIPAGNVIAAETKQKRKALSKILDTKIHEEEKELASISLDTLPR